MVSAPSGVGKTTIVQSVLSEWSGVKFSVSCTTRLPRPGEIDGRSYHFLSREEFLRGIPEGRFVEWAQVHGEYYGTDGNQVEGWLSEGLDVLLDIDVQGARRLRCAYPAAHTIFVLPPSLEVLAERLRNRGTESPEQLALRLAAAHREMQEAPWYDFIIVNDVLEEAISRFQRHSKGMSMFQRSSVAEVQTPPLPRRSRRSGRPYMKERSRSTSEVWITGVNPVKEALKAERMPVRELILARTDRRAEELAELAGTKGIPIRRETREALTTLAGHEHHQGAALRAEEFHYTDLETLLGRPAAEREPLVVLDTVQDPQNLGAVLRSACFLGAKGVVIPADRSVKVTGTVIKIAAGATSYLPVVQVVNLARTLDTLKECGIWTVGLDAGESMTIYEVDLTVPVALVVGNEQKGLRPLVKKHCDLLAGIPAHGPIDSLNAATASAVALAEVQRQRFAGRS